MIYQYNTIQYILFQLRFLKGQKQICIHTTNIKILRQTTITHSFIPSKRRGCHGRDRMVLGFTTTYTINVYHYLSCELESHS